MPFCGNDITRFFVVFLLICMPGMLFAQHNAALTINNIPVVFQPDRAEWMKAELHGDVGNQVLVLLRTDRVFSAGEQQKLGTGSIQLKEYVGRNMYSAWIDQAADFTPYTNITGIARFLPEYKIASSVYEKSLAERELTAFVSFFKGIDHSIIEALILQQRGIILPDQWQRKGYYKIRIPSQNLQALASFYGVQYIGEVSQQLPLDLDSKGGEGAVILNMPGMLGGKDLRGKDVIVGHGDNCSGIYHIDQSDRVINYNNGRKAEHGVLVHGLIGGEGIMDPAGQGIATEGTCISLYFDAVLLLKEELFKGFNATLTNNSYAAIVGNCSYSGTYDVLSQNLDEMAFKTTEQLDVFAAGNDGRLVCGIYPEGYYNICGGYQTAKNILTVGSCFRDLSISATSGRGPLRDGRLKPEICAVGANIYCPVPDDSYTYTSGTSLACPQATGILALLTERYRQLHGNSNPGSDLLKAIAINGASDLGRPGPDFWYGFGFVNGVRSLGIIENNWYAQNTLVSGGAIQSFTITVPANTAQLKVLLYYHDRAASASASAQLVNDLDLTVTEPDGVLHRPLVPDPDARFVGNDAVERTDRLNNAEQVSIYNPVPGTYTINVSEFVIPTGAQDYVIAYDLIPDHPKLLFPVANATAPAGTDMYIYWDAPAYPALPTQVSFSPDNGVTWVTLDAAVPANTRYYKWPVPVLNSNQCLIRIAQGGKSDESGPFTINQQSVLTLAAMQCPGSVAVNWTGIPGADKYYMLLKKGPYFQKVDSVNAGVLAYNFTGLNTNADHYVSVVPVIGGRDGFRSKAVSRKPNTGTCGAAADGDLTIDAILSPESGRRFTGSALKSNTALKVNVRNQDDFRVSDYSISYKVNAGPWKTIPSFSIGANTNAAQVIDLYDFSDAIDYFITVAVSNKDRPDPVPSNDTFVAVIKHIPNNSLTLSGTLKNDFEMLPDLTLLKDTIGLSEDGYWDFSTSNDTGRLRTRIPGSTLVNTNGSISMDVNMNTRENVNYLTGTFNLSNYDTTADEVRFDFEYEMRGMPLVKDSNKVWIRGADQEEWIPAFIYNNTPASSALHYSGTLSLRDILRSRGQNFSASSQIRFGQFDSALIVDDYYGGGITLDNIHIYKVSRDLQLNQVIAPAPSDCALNSSPVTIKIKNGTTAAMGGIAVGYVVDDGSPVTEFLPDPIAGDDSVTYTFFTGISGLSFGSHKLKIWIHADGDDFMKNDTIGLYEFYNSPLLSSFPYLQDFESTGGDWYATGRNISWAYGTLSGKKIGKAASGARGWKTGLSGTYNSNEQSYLVSPCINTGILAEPMISFSTAFDLEYCEESACDRVFLEYSEDQGKNWNKLGSGNSGTNWYNHPRDHVWTGAQARWHVASIPLPRTAALKLRFVMQSDMGLNLEGFALDDIHIFDLKNKIVTVAEKERKQSGWLVPEGSAWFYFTESNELICALNPSVEQRVLTSATIFGQARYMDEVKRQYYFPRSWAVHAGVAPSVTSMIRLYITDAEVNKVWADTVCRSCTKAEDIYRTGITQYPGRDGHEGDSVLFNNEQNASVYHQYNKVKWVPYDNGYYAEFEAAGLGEFWLNDGGILGTLPVNTEYVILKAQRIDQEQAGLSWKCAIDSQMMKFSIERSGDKLSYLTLGEELSRKAISADYHYLDHANVQEGDTVYYRLFCTAMNGKTFYSNVSAVPWLKANQLLSIYPVPSADGHLTIKWTGQTSASLMVTDVSGKTLFHSVLQSFTWLNESVINLDFLARGIYYLKLKIDSNTYVEKVIFK